MPTLRIHVPESPDETLRLMPARIKQFGMAIKPPFPVADSLVLLGQAVLVLYKDPHDEESNYNTFITQRINTLRAHSRVPCSTYSNNRISFAKAKAIRSILGSSVGLKRSLLDSSNSSSRRLKNICSYLCDVVAWSGMEAIVFICHTLWQPRSPALEQESIQLEVKNFEKAFEKIAAAPHPKYFNILSPPDETSLIETRRFPTIIELAKLIVVDSSTRWFNVQGNPISPRLNQLKEIHDNSLNRLQGPIQLSTQPQAMQHNIEIQDEFIYQVLAYGFTDGLRWFYTYEEYKNYLFATFNPEC